MKVRYIPIFCFALKTLTTRACRSGMSVAAFPNCIY